MPTTTMRTTGRKPVIGVVPLVDYQRESLWMLPGYLDGIREAGGLPVTLPLTSDAAELAQLLAMVDGLLVTGGQDVTPALYGDDGDEAARLTGERSPERDAMEARLVPAAIGADLPTLGICRGIQVINALLGGTLWQDIPTQLPSGLEHHGTPPYSRPVHEVEVLAGTPLAQAIGPGALAVNSYHHQGVRALAPELAPMAIAPDGLVEALWRPASRWLWAVQWHPEFSHETDAASRAIFSAFVSAALSK